MVFKDLLKKGVGFPHHARHISATIQNGVVAFWKRLIFWPLVDLLLVLRSFRILMISSLEASECKSPLNCRNVWEKLYVSLGGK